MEQSSEHDIMKFFRYMEVRLVNKFFILIINMLKKCLKLFGYFCNLCFINKKQVKVKAFSYFVELGNLITEFPFFVNMMELKKI